MDEPPVPPAPGAPLVRHAFPSGALFPFVDRIWSWEPGGDGPWPPALVLPGSGDELFFHLGEPFRVGRGREAPASRGPCHLMSLRHGPARIDFTGSRGFVGVRFRAGGLRRFHGVPHHLLADSLTPAGDFLGPGADALARRMADAQDFPRRAELVLAWLLGALRPRDARSEGVDWAIRQLYYGYAIHRLDDLTNRLGMTPRHFQRLVRDRLGVGPKAHARLARFQHVARPMVLSGRRYALEGVLAQGYYDQSHFLKDFKELAGEPPGAFLRAVGAMSHFYYTSRPDNAILGASNIPGGFPCSS